ncbi:Asp-tRNA(Asn)/Glu-tRNA(Gln) amidotransferase subunit GatC [Opitutales bacterium ASA1]|uniref:Asp-tRNA(Asn)/Glu-tRNA(Gln) amidotransferase subunit GatC n=1 Tax=Congregicoccus parvus TaxID=3081749 RepID=UPI002B2FFFBA|nr:Asp-tRNA(Asn)/Glu-tRNA(Gln) amidotransferase subunit GatC [Opitutales bacterium ASA1]
MSDTSHLDIDYVAQLARLALGDAEKERIAKQLGDVLGYVRQLEAVNIEGVEPMAHAFDVVNVWQADEPRAGLSVDDALRNAPASRDHMFVVPKVVDDA